MNKIKFKKIKTRNTLFPFPKYLESTEVRAFGKKVIVTDHLEPYTLEVLETVLNIMQEHKK